MLLTIIAGVIAALAVVDAIVYLSVRTRSTRAYGDFKFAEGDKVIPARDIYWRLDRLQFKIALSVVALYAIGLLVLLPFAKLPVTGLNLVSIIVLSLAAVSTSTFASIQNGRESSLSMKAEMARHERASRRWREPIA